MDQTENAIDSTENANSDEVLHINNYLGNYQNIHPKVLHFPNKWNGFNYWMAYTPYPIGSIEAENPCIAVSNDMINWTVPSGLSNPLDPFPVDGYNSDTHLVHRTDTNVLEIWWRHYRESDGKRLFYRRTSNDGISWTNKELVFSATATTEMLSPAIIFENGKYKIWFINGGGVKYDEMSTSLVWTPQQSIEIDWSSQNLIPWHLDVIPSDLGYEMIVTAYKSDTGTNNTADLFYVLQNQTGVTTKPKLILAKSKNPLAIDYTGIYRSSIIKVNGVYYLFYSCLDKDLNRWMALSYGSSIFGLNGFKHFRQGEKVLILTDAGETEIDVSEVDTVLIMGSGQTTITMIRGGYLGKKISIIMGSNSATAQCTINYRPNYLELPLKKPIVLSYTGNKNSVDLICYKLINGFGWSWKTDSYTPPEISRKSKNVLANEILTDFDVTDVDIILLSGAGITINSLSGGYYGKIVHLIATSGGTNATLKYSTQLLTPGLADVTLTPEKMGMTAICMNVNTNSWRVF